MNNAQLVDHCSAPGDYLHDVFISLPHVPKWVTWADSIFLPMLQDELYEQLGDRQPKVYVSRHEMAPGDTWPVELAKNHARSRTLFALCTNTYRYKEWCQIEFSMMRAREETCGLRTPDKPQTLLVPGIGWDCDDSPEFLHGIEPINLKEYAFPELPAQCDARVELRKRIQLIAGSLAEGIRECPSFDPAWETMTCDRFLDLFKRQTVNPSQSRPPRMDGL